MCKKGLVFAFFAHSFWNSVRTDFCVDWCQLRVFGGGDDRRVGLSSHSLTHIAIKAESDISRRRAVPRMRSRIRFVTATRIRSDLSSSGSFFLRGTVRPGDYCFLILRDFLSLLGLPFHKSGLRTIGVVFFGLPHARSTDSACH